MFWLSVFNRISYTERLRVVLGSPKERKKLVKINDGKAKENTQRKSIKMYKCISSPFSNFQTVWFLMFRLLLHFFIHNHWHLRSRRVFKWAPPLVVVPSYTSIQMWYPRKRTVQALCFFFSYVCNWRNRFIHRQFQNTKTDCVWLNIVPSKSADVFKSDASFELNIYT